jgi:broad specificity phosphatase PhoE
VALYLVRHAQAGVRALWKGDDRSRPLTDEGRRQAADLVGIFADVELNEIWSSPFLRCVETVAALGARKGLRVKVCEALGEGSHMEALSLARRLADTNVLFCSHGDIIPGLLDSFATFDGVDLGPQPRCQKGSTWILEPDDERERFVSAIYVPPPLRD